MSQRYMTWIEARTAALEKAHRLGLDVAIRRVKEFGKVGYNVACASLNDSDYTTAEIIHPKDQI